MLAPWENQSASLPRQGGELGIISCFSSLCDFASSLYWTANWLIWAVTQHKKHSGIHSPDCQETRSVWDISSWSSITLWQDYSMPVVSPWCNFHAATLEVAADWNDFPELRCCERSCHFSICLPYCVTSVPSLKIRLLWSSTEPQLGCCKCHCTGSWQESLKTNVCRDKYLTFLFASEKNILWYLITWACLCLLTFKRILNLFI